MSNNDSVTYFIRVTKVKEHYSGWCPDIPGLQHTSDSIVGLINWFKEDIEERTWQESSGMKAEKRILTEADHNRSIKGDEVLIPIQVLKRNYKLPGILYLYIPFNEFLPKMLVEPYIWFSKANKFNDPFEIPLVLNDVWSPPEKLDAYIKFAKAKAAEENFDFDLEDCKRQFIHLTMTDSQKLDDFLTAITRGYEEASDDCVIAYFSRTAHSVLMWSHYAKKHTGVVIGYDFKSLSKKFTEGGDVDYRRHKASINPGSIMVSGIKDGKITPEFATYLFRKFFTKNPYWSYEEEYRFIQTGDEGPYPIEAAAVREIHFGLNMEKPIRAMLLSLARTTKLKVYAIKVHEEINLRSEEIPNEIGVI